MFECVIAGKRDIDGRLASAQTALMLQEETIRRNERERKQMLDKINNLERNISAIESDKRQLEVCEASRNNSLSLKLINFPSSRIVHHLEICQPVFIDFEWHLISFGRRHGMPFILQS